MKLWAGITLLFVIALFLQEVYSATKLTADKLPVIGNVVNSDKVLADYYDSFEGQDRNIRTVDEEIKVLKNRNAHLNEIFLSPFKNMDRIKRRALYPEPLSSMDNPALQNKLTECAVDTRTCDCYTDLRTNRSHINCRYKYLYSIPTFTLVDTVYYEITFSTNNFISSLPYEAFRNLKVERIDLLNNKISSVSPGAFLGLNSSLKELLIEGNGKNGIEIPFASMSILSKLRRLRVKNFKQDRLSEINYFGSFPQLEALEFDTVSLKYIDRLAFKGKLPKLLHLDFGYVEFTQIPVESLSFLPSLSKLYIRFTKIDTIYSESFVKLTNLLDLDLSFNQIETLGNDAFLGVSNHLTHLDIGSNKLKPDSLLALSSKRWTNLKHLTLSLNHGLTNIPANVFKNMPNLEELFLVELNLVHISRDLFTGLNNLQSLDLSWNNIESIQDGSFQYMDKLYELKLEYQFKSGNAGSPKALQLIPGAFKGLEESLVYLHLEGTTLDPQQFWETLSIFKELQQLAISETKLSEMPNYAFHKNKKLSKIELNKNGIKHLNQATFKGLEQSLKDISLNDNELSTISDCVFKNFTKLENLHLLRNPLLCDCRLKWLHMFIFEKNRTVPTFLINDFVCKQPQNYAEQTLYKIPINDLICTTDFPERCVYDVNPPVTRETGVTSKTTTRSTNNKISLKLTIASKTSSSITLAWSVSDKSRITGFKLEYKLTTQHGSGHEEYIHRDQITHTIYNLVQGKFYQLCVTAEVNAIEEESIEDCRTTQTLGESSDTEKQTEENNSNDKDGENRNVIIGAIIATVAVVVLIAVGVCAVVKYKVQKLKEIQFAINSPIQRQLAEEGMKVCVVPNEYSEIDVARLANKYKIKCPKNMQRQFGVDNSCFDSGDESSPYNTYQKIGKGRRKNPYENDDDEEPVHLNIETDAVHFKTDLEGRHSAPSRLDASDLKNQYDRNSRPLPATPANTDNQKRSSTLKPVKKVKPVKKQVFVAKASVYNNQDQIEKQNETLNTEIHDSK